MADATFEEFFASGGGGGVDVGDSTLQHPSGTYYTKGAQMYLQSGFYVDKTSYPVAAADERCKVTGLPVTLPVSLKAYESAHDGAGTVVVAYNSTNILRSTDYGATWSIVATGSGVVISSAVWAGTRFVIGGNDATTIELRRSNDGSSWAAGGTVTSSGMAPSSLTGAWNGSLAMFVAKNNVNAAVTTPDGSALTQRTLPSALQSCFIVALGASFLLGASFSGDSYSTTTGAGGSFTTISAAAATFTTQPIDAAVVGGLAILVTSGGPYATSPDLMTWTRRALPVASVPGAGRGDSRPLTSDGVRAYWGGASFALWTEDGVNWVRRDVTVNQGDGAVHVTAGGRAVLPTGGTSQRTTAAKTADWTVADFVGSTSAWISGALVAFKRIR